jgi:hypothetical protein
MNHSSRWVGRLTLGAAVLATASLALVGARYGLPMVFLIVAGGLLVGVIGLLWLSILSLGGETAMTVEEALSLAAPPMEEEQKRAVLRALKDLEYERGMGKIAEADYAELSQRYRGEAKALLVELDQSLTPARRTVEKLIDRRLRADRKAAAERSPEESKQDPEPDPAELDSVRAAAITGPSRRCSSCNHRSPLSADRCTACGCALGGQRQTLCRSCPAVYDDSLAECPMCGVEKGAE